MLIKDVWITKGLVAVIAKQTRCHKRTVEKWIMNGRIPETPYRLLEITQNGQLKHIHNDWTGWRICSRTGQMRTPNGDKVSQGDIQAIRYRKRQIAQMQLEIREMRAQLQVNEAFALIKGELASLSRS